MVTKKQIDEAIEQMRKANFRANNAFPGVTIKQFKNYMKQFGKDNGAGAPTVFIPGGGAGAPVTTR